MWSLGHLQIASCKAQAQQSLNIKIERKLKKLKFFATPEIYYFKLKIFIFNSDVYYLTCAFIALTRAFNFEALAFNHATCAFSFLTRAFEFVTRTYELITQLVTRVLLFHLLKSPLSGNEK